MTEEAIREAEEECKRFLRRVKALRQSQDAKLGYFSSKESGAVRRASMDLTRALAQLRKSQ